MIGLRTSGIRLGARARSSAESAQSAERSDRLVGSEGDLVRLAFGKDCGLCRRFADERKRCRRDLIGKRNMMPTGSHRTSALLEPELEQASAWEETACLLCGSERWSPLVESQDRASGVEGRWYMVAQCQDCGLCFGNPRPVATATPARVASSAFQPRLPRWRHRVPMIRDSSRSLRMALPPHGQGRLLDVGGISQHFLHRSLAQGWKVVALASHPAEVQALRERLGLSALVGDLADADFPSSSFDAVTFWHTLDRHRDPLRTLQAAFASLAPGGKIYVSAPNIDSLAFRWFGQNWTGLDLPRRHVHFTPWTLRLMLLRAGFRNLRLRTIRRSASLRASADLSPSRHRWLRSHAAAYCASWFAYLTGRADDMVAVASRPGIGRQS